MRNATCMLMLMVGIGTGCGYPEADFPSQEELYDTPATQADGSCSVARSNLVLKTARGTVVDVKVDAFSIVGTQVNLGRYSEPTDRAIRGQAFDQWVDLSVAGDRVTGMIGARPIDIAGGRNDNTLYVSGVMRGYPAEVRFNDTELSGTLGKCNYALKRVEAQDYAGTVQCTGAPHQVHLTIPAELKTWSDGELAAALGILLGADEIPAKVSNPYILRDG